MGLKHGTSSNKAQQIYQGFTDRAAIRSVSPIGIEGMVEGAIMSKKSVGPVSSRSLSSVTMVRRCDLCWGELRPSNSTR